MYNDKAEEGLANEILPPKQISNASLFGTIGIQNSKTHTRSSRRLITFQQKMKY